MAINRVAKFEKVGPSIKDWAVNIKVAAIYDNGDTLEISKDFSLNVPEYEHTKSRIHSMGGDLKVNNVQTKVIDYLKDDESVEEVFYRYVEDIHQFLIKTKEHDPDIDLHLADVYWNIVDEGIENIRFIPIPSEYFSKSDLPQGAVQIIRR